MAHGFSATDLNVNSNYQLKLYNSTQLTIIVNVNVSVARQELTIAFWDLLYLKSFLRYARFLRIAFLRKS